MGDNRVRGKESGGGGGGRGGVEGLERGWLVVEGVGRGREGGVQSPEVRQA